MGGRRAQVGEQDRSYCGRHVGRAGRKLRNRSEKLVERPFADLEHALRASTMSFDVTRDDRFPSRSLCQAEDGTRVGVEPIRVVANTELFLDREVFHVDRKSTRL